MFIFLYFQELWPNEKTWHWFERAAQCGNVGASIKLAVALLYNEGGKKLRFLIVEIVLER